MRVIGSIIVPLAFSQKDEVRNVTARIVHGIGFIFGALFIRVNRSTLSFDTPRGFQMSPGTPWVPFESHAQYTSIDRAVHQLPARTRQAYGTKIEVRSRFLDTLAGTSF